MEKMLLKSTTRHVRIFTAVVKNSELIFDPRKLTIDIDPDNEFLWNDGRRILSVCKQKSP